METREDVRRAVLSLEDALEQEYPGESLDPAALRTVLDELQQRQASPLGHVVVLFGSAADEWCTLNKCPMGLVRWFADHDEARAYAESVPDGFEPHILMVEPARHVVPVEVEQ